MDLSPSTCSVLVPIKTLSLPNANSPYQIFQTIIKNKTNKSLPDFQDSPPALALFPNFYNKVLKVIICNCCCLLITSPSYPFQSDLNLHQFREKLIKLTNDFILLNLVTLQKHVTQITSSHHFPSKIDHTLVFLTHKVSS